MTRTKKNKGKTCDLIAMWRWNQTIKAPLRKRAMPLIVLHQV
jgi:hypothetical protein